MYLRGSVPQGTAVEGLSDLDCIVYFWIYDGKNDDASSSQSLMTSAALRQSLSDVAKKLQKRFPFCIKVSLMMGGSRHLFAECGWIQFGIAVCGNNQYLASLSVNVQVEVKAFGVRKGGPVSVALAADPPSQLPESFRLPESFEISTSAVRLAGEDLAAILTDSAAFPIPNVLPTLAEVEYGAQIDCVVHGDGVSCLCYEYEPSNA